MNKTNSTMLKAKPNAETPLATELPTTLALRPVSGGVKTFDAVLITHPDPTGMGMDTWQVNATLELDYDKTVERLDDMEPPFLHLSGGEEVYFTVVGGTNDKKFTATITDIASEPAHAKAVFRFRSLVQIETYNF